MFRSLFSTYCSTKNNSTIIKFSSSLFNYIFYIHPIGHVSVAVCLYVKTSLSKCKTILITSAYRFINSFLSEMFCTRTRFETEVKGNMHPWAAHRSLWFQVQNLLTYTALSRSKLCPVPPVPCKRKVEPCEFLSVQKYVRTRVNVA